MLPLLPKPPKLPVLLPNQKEPQLTPPPHPGLVRQSLVSSLWVPWVP
jgi:hypothetical protein